MTLLLFRSVVVICSTLLSSWCWVQYIRAANSRQRIKAGLSDCAIIGLQMINVVGVVEDHRLAVPILLAAYVGTHWSVGKR